MFQISYFPKQILMDKFFQELVLLKAIYLLISYRRVVFSRDKFDLSNFTSNSYDLDMWTHEFYQQRSSYRKKCVRGNGKPLGRILGILHGLQFIKVFTRIFFFFSNSLILLWQVTRESECTQLILWSAKMYIHRHGQLHTFVKVWITIRDAEYEKKKTHEENSSRNGI